MGRICVLAFLTAGVSAAAEDLMYKAALTASLNKAVPGILSTFDSETGHFGSGIWIVTDQNVMFPLAVAYAREAEGNTYYKSAELLDVIMKAGDALIEDADANGQWVFRKKDGSTWGMIHMPWTYSRWVRAYALIKDDMPPERRARWEQALLLGYTKIAANNLRKVHNIPAHHAMGLYVAGKTLDRPEWCAQAAAFMQKVIDEQREGGYWSEGSGPVVTYNFVYVDALGVYYALSGDTRALQALEKAALFHRHFTYPNGHNVETIDERNPYHANAGVGQVGFTFSPVGRAYLKTQWAFAGQDKLGADYAASLLLYGEEGSLSEEPAGGGNGLFVMTEGGIERAATWRPGPWFVCMSAYCSPIPESRWLQDRQNLVSVFHDRAGLITGGGNTKLQPAWSTFTVGDPALLQHTPGDESPDFFPKGELYHVPSAAAIAKEPPLGLELVYGKETCRVWIIPVDDTTIEYHLAATVSSGLPVAAHITLLPHLEQPLTTAAGKTVDLNQPPADLSAADIGGAITYAGCRFELPSTASVHWPARAHNPYAKAGEAGLEAHRIEIRLPFDADHLEHAVKIKVLL